MMARDDPDHIQVLRDGEVEKTPDQIKTLSFVGAWDAMRGGGKEEFLLSKIPVKLRDALQRRNKLKDARSIPA